MEQQLADLGYFRAERATMTPQQAVDIINAGVYNPGTPVAPVTPVTPVDPAAADPVQSGEFGTPGYTAVVPGAAPAAAPAPAAIGEEVSFMGQPRIIASRMEHPQEPGKFLVSFADDPRTFVYESDLDATETPVVAAAPPDVTPPVDTPIPVTPVTPVVPAAPGPIPGDITRNEIQVIADDARKAYLNGKELAQKGPNKGQHTKENQKAANQAAFQAVAEAHAARLPADYDGIKLTASPLGHPEVSGTIQPGRPFDDYLLELAGMPEGDPRRATIQSIQDKIGDTISITYAHAPGKVTDPNYAATRRASQRKNPAKWRISQGTAQNETKVFKPQKMKFSFGERSINTLGTNPEKLLGNFGWAEEAMGVAGEPMPYRNVSDPRFVADLKGLQANHDAGFTWEGKPIVGLEAYPAATNKPSAERAPYQGFLDRNGVPDVQRFEFLNLLLGNEGSRYGKTQTPIQKAKLDLAEKNRGKASPPIREDGKGETNELRERLNTAMGPQALLDADGNPTGKTDRWSNTFLEDPLNEMLRIDNILAIAPAVERGVSPLHEHAYSGDLDRHLGSLKTVNTEQERIAAASRFMPEEEATPQARARARQRDRSYMAAVAAGDREEQQRLVDEARLLPRTVMYVGSTEIVRNPTGEDRRKLSSEEREEYPRGQSGDPSTRFTKDKNGNTWIWRSSKGMHSQIEPDISRKEGVTVGQNEFNPNTADPITRDNQGNVIPLSERFNPATGDIRFMPEDASTAGAEEKPSSIKRRAATLWKEKGTDSPFFRRFFGIGETESKVVDKITGQPLTVFHGTARPDRVADRFRKSRATSGPMAFFTDARDIAEKYSKGKADTSLEYPSDYRDWFAIKTPGSKRETNLKDAWFNLTSEKRADVNKKLLEVGYENFDEGEGAIVSGSRSIINPESIAYEIRQAKGNGLEAAKSIWLDSGSLFNDEVRFLEVLKALGIEGARLNDPNQKNPYVYEVYLNIKNPLRNSNVPASVVDALQQAAKRQRKRPEIYGADQWDKNTRDPVEWITAFAKDVETYNKNKDAAHFMSLTSIPDWVTKTLKSLGFDGIQDVGGKQGGKSHDVWIPFDENQVKSATDNSGTFDLEKKSINFMPEDVSAAGAEGKTRARAAILWKEKGTESPFFKKWKGKAMLMLVGDDLRETKNSKPVVIEGFHGTTHSFSVINPQKANIENDFGKGFYISNTPADVGANYAGEGPDLTSRIEKLSEQIESNIYSMSAEKAQDSFGITAKEFELLNGNWQRVQQEYADRQLLLYELARTKLVGEGPVTMKVFAKLENPLKLGENEGYWDVNFSEDGEPAGKMIEFVEALRNEAKQYKYDQANFDESEFGDIAYDGASPSKAIEAARKSIPYATDDAGDSATNEIIRAAIERMGYDGIIDGTVNKKFGSQRRTGKQMEGMGEDTHHIIIFDSKQVKSATGNTGEFDASNPDISFMPEDERQTPQERAKARLSNASRPWTKEERAAGHRTMLGYEDERLPYKEHPPSGVTYPAPGREGLGGRAGEMFSAPRRVDKLKPGQLVHYEGEWRTVETVREAGRTDERWLDFTDGQSVKFGSNIELPTTNGDTAALRRKTGAVSTGPEAETEAGALQGEATGKVAESPQERAKARIAGRYDEPIREEMQNPAPGEQRFMPETTMREDNRTQMQFLDKEAKARGFDGMDDLMEKEPGQQVKIMAKWRFTHPRDTKGNYLQNTTAEAINRTLYGAQKPDGNTPIAGGSVRAASQDSLEDAIAHLGGGERASEAGAGGAGQREKLVAWAEKAGALLPRLPRSLKREATGDREDHGGMEHHVWFGGGGSKRWIKATRGDGSKVGNKPVVLPDGTIALRKASPAEYLKQRSDWNALMGDDIRLHAVERDKFGNVSIVTSQPDIKGEPVTQQEIDTDMQEAGYEKFNEVHFYRRSDNAAIFDLHPGNAVKVGNQVVAYDGIALHPDAKLRAAIGSAMDNLRANEGRGDPVLDYQRNRFMPDTAPEAPRQRPDPRSAARARMAARTQQERPERELATAR